MDMVPLPVQPNAGATCSLLLRALDERARALGLSLQDTNCHDALIADMRRLLADLPSDGARLHGFRTQAMFAHVSFALGNAVKELDGGVLLSGSAEDRSPDFLVAPRDTSSILVEVKNYFKGPRCGPLKIKRRYVSALKACARFMNLPLYFAVYWSRWNLWTLTASDRLDHRDKEWLQISFGDALMRNEMSLLGDYSVGTTPPISLRVYTDATSPRKVQNDGMVHARIERACLSVGGDEIEDPFERKVAWFFMLYGKWHRIQNPVRIEDDELIFLEMEVSPEHVEEDQNFQMVGFMSEMFSAQYNQLTTGNGNVLRLAPLDTTTKIGIEIPRGYEGSALKLWRFEQLPNFRRTGPMT